MTQVHSSDDYKFYINDKDHPPPHAHVYRGGSEAIVNLRSCEIMENEGFSRKELAVIRKLTREVQAYLLRVWEEKHGAR